MTPLYRVLACMLAFATSQLVMAGGEPGLKIVTTTGMIKDVVQQVAGDRATVVSIMGEGVDPHLYQPTSADVRKVLGADMVFANGLKLEGRMTEVFEKSRSMGNEVVIITDRIDKSTCLESPDYPGEHDPHVWHDVTMWTSSIPIIVGELTRIDPEGAEQYKANGETYADRLNALHGYATWVIGTIPREQRVLITAHDAFGYFGRTYGVEVRGVQGITTESEAGIRDINAMVDFIVDRQITAVFIESSVSERNVQALVEGASSRGHEVKVGGMLYSDSMGAPGTWEGTYEGMIEHNVNLMAASLGGTVPEGGFRGARTRAAEGS
jgi:manganese/zinc/iron transport system substrate-binding protein